MNHHKNNKHLTSQINIQKAKVFQISIHLYNDSYIIDKKKLLSIKFIVISSYYIVFYY
jgi:hypothetical protein